MGKIQEEVRNIVRLDNEIARLTKQKEKSKQTIQKYMDANQLKKLDIDETDRLPSMIVSYIERANITYNIDILKQNLPADTFNEIITKAYLVTDMDGLIRLLKKHGVSSKDFKQFIYTSTSVNKNAIKQLYAVGDITKKHLQGTYTATITKSIQIKEKKGKEDDE